jgi:hypothetical protein
MFPKDGSSIIFLKYGFDRDKFVAMSKLPPAVKD